MRVFMLGWEFPPFVAGGLGTACHGLTRAMVDQGHHITFVLPKAVDLDVESHVDLLGPNHVRAEWQPSQTAEPKPVTSVVRVPGQPRSIETEHVEAGEDEHLEAATRVMASDATAYPGVPDGVETIFQKVRSGWVRSNRARRDVATTESRRETRWLPEIAHATGDDISAMLESVDQLARGAAGHYGSDLIGDSRRYALASSALAVSRDFDVVHAHDWLAYPAGIAVRAATGKPLVVHVHATEFDRSGDSVNQQVYDIERRGMHEADRVIAVSQLTKNICIHRYGVPGEKIDVVYNGVEQGESLLAEGARIEQDDKIVLFLGRITMQKGPEYFIRAAARVLEKIENVKFLVAGSGDMAVRMIDHAAELGIGHKVLFTGFLRGRDVEHVFELADCYVMPSVSEPFGIAPLEAMRHDTPVIISKQSGVSEVLTHALKVDFWDTDEMANKIVAVLKYPPLSTTLREHGALELRGLTWEGAAINCVKSYGRAIAGA